MYYILIETQDNNGVKSATSACYTDLATAKEAYYAKAQYTPKTAADYMGIMLIRNDGSIIMPTASGPETVNA